MQRRVEQVLAVEVGFVTGSLVLDRLQARGERLVPLPRECRDVAALAWKWHKPLSARLQPVKDKRAGDKTDFDSQYLFNTTLHPGN